MSVTLARGGGLSADYFENVWFFYTPVMTRVDAQINFDWGEGSITATAADYVCVRWTGLLLPPYTEQYTFYADADDGARLWVNNIQLIDRWDSGANMTAAKMSLKANTFYRIKLEYCNASSRLCRSPPVTPCRYKDLSGPAKVALLWSSPSIIKEIVPASQLCVLYSPQPFFPAAPPTTFFPAPATSAFLSCFCDYGHVDDSLCCP
jgi:hypothetical protein